MRQNRRGQEPDGVKNPDKKCMSVPTGKGEQLPALANLFSKPSLLTRQANYTKMINGKYRIAANYYKEHGALLPLLIGTPNSQRVQQPKNDESAALANQSHQ